jgi:hypothetical protein
LKLDRSFESDVPLLTLTHKSTSILTTFNWGNNDDSGGEEEAILNDFTEKLYKEWTAYLGEYALYANKNPVEFWFVHEHVSKYLLLWYFSVNGTHFSNSTKLTKIPPFDAEWSTLRRICFQNLNPIISNRDPGT